MKDRRLTTAELNRLLDGARGNPEWFDDVYYSLHAILYKYLMKIFDRKELVEDVMQDFYVEVFEGKFAMKEGMREHPLSYILVVCHRKALNIIRREKCFVKLNVKADELIYAFEDTCVQNMQARRYLELLDPLDQEIAVLKFWKGKNMVEIASQLDCEYEAIKKRFIRNLHFLKNY